MLLVFPHNIKSLKKKDLEDEMPSANKDRQNELRIIARRDDLPKKATPTNSQPSSYCQHEKHQRETHRRTYKKPNGSGHVLFRSRKD
jgi:hypothetical protein